MRFNERIETTRESADASSYRVDSKFRVLDSR